METQRPQPCPKTSTIACVLFIALTTLLSSGRLVAAVLIEELAIGSAPLRDGLAVGDTVTGWWRMDETSGTFETPFDWLAFGVDVAPRGAVRLLGERAGRPLEIWVEEGLWRSDVRPVLSGDVLDSYLDGARQAADDRHAAAAEIWQRLASTVESRGVRCWLLYRVIGAQLEADAFAAAEATAEEALAVAKRSMETLMIKRQLGIVQLRRSTLDASERTLKDVAAMWRAERAGTLGEVEAWLWLSEVAESRGDLEAMLSWLERAETRLGTLAPKSILRARAFAAKGRQAYESGRYDDAETAHRRAAEMIGAIAPDSVQVAVAWLNLGIVPAVRGDLDASETYLQKAWTLFERLEPRSLNAAACLNNLGALSYQRGDLEATERYFLQALEIREERLPDSVSVAMNLTNLGVVARARGDLDRAWRYYERAVDIQRVLAPQSNAVATTWINLGNLASESGDLVAAEGYYLEALELQKRLAAEGLGRALVMANLGELAQLRGDFASAEAWYRQAMVLQEKAAPRGEKMAKLLHDLGGLALDRGDWTAAEESLNRALELAEEKAPESLEVASLWNTKGALAMRRGLLDQAAESHARGLAIQETIAPDSLRVTRSLIHLGDVFFERGQLTRARAVVEQALEILTTALEGGSYATASALSILGEIELASGRLELAAGHLGQAHALLEQLGIESYRRVLVLDRLAHLARTQGQTERAWSYLEEATRQLETQIGRFGGAVELHGRFRGRFGDTYRAAIDVLLELGRPEAAFEMLESRRARGLLTLLAERDLVFGDVPEAVEAKRRQLANRYDRVLGQLAELADAPAEEERLRGLLERLHGERRALRSELREISPRLAELEESRPTSLAAIRDALDPETLLLSYSVGEQETRLFALGRDAALRVFPVRVGEAELRQKIEGFQRLIAERRHSQSGAFRALTAAGAELFELLLGPAADLLESHPRLLIVPDGPLFRLPFAALVLPEEDRRYLVERWPLHTVSSAMLYRQLRQGRDRHVSTAPRLAVFGGPLYGTQTAALGHDPQVRSAARRFEFPPLPGSRREAESIARLFPRSTELFLGAEATEEQVKGLDRDTRIVHFATHGLLDEQFPLDSALVLTLPENPGEGRENGLLQVWEIFEQLRIHADLVVLSACQTASGEYVDGEGTIGLTRAFHYAGARSVLASLWQVDDPATGEWMVQFYRALSRGASKDDALRAAQLTMIRRAPDEAGRDVSSPWYWAAFQLHGDRR